MFKSPSFQFLFAGLSLPQQLISLMSFLNSWLLENRVSAWKPGERSVSLVPPVEAVNGLSTASRQCIACSAPKA